MRSGEKTNIWLHDMFLSHLLITNCTMEITIHTGETNDLKKFSFYLTVNTHSLHYKHQSLPVYCGYAETMWQKCSHMCHVLCSLHCKITLKFMITVYGKPAEKGTYAYSATNVCNLGYILADSDVNLMLRKRAMSQCVTSEHLNCTVKMSAF
jgi:hypothetical protein